MSDYKRGKNMTHAWAAHWDAIADVADRYPTIEAKMIEYGQPIRTAFTKSYVPDTLAVPMPDYVRVTHRCIMDDLSVEHRESILVWHFGDDDERWIKFGKLRREPTSLVPIYKKIGRRHRGGGKWKPSSAKNAKYDILEVDNKENS